METWLWLLAALLLGVALGAAAVWIWKGRGRDEVTVSRLDRELKAYKQEVSDHFVRTAELVNELTNSYKAVYEHLEGGAYRLVGEETLRERLADVEQEPVMLEYMGSRERPAQALPTDEADYTGGNATRPDYGNEGAEEAGYAADSDAEGSEERNADGRVAG